MDNSRFNFNIFEEYEESVRLQAALHLLRILIDEAYYYNNKSVNDIVNIINKTLNSLRVDNKERIELERKALFHLNKHLLLGQDYNIKKVYERWTDEKQYHKKTVQENSETHTQTDEEETNQPPQSH